MEGSYNLYLVALSYVVATAASYTALELARRVSGSTGAIANVWLGGGAISMGIGIWTMHFIGMLAFSLPMPFAYDVFITLLSLLVGIAAAAFAIYIASRPSNSYAKIGLAGLFLGGGIAGMHYTGMAAMEMDATISYDPQLFGLSVLIAVAAACAAIWIMFTLLSTQSEYLRLMKVGAAMIMGIAICGMHYTGMAAAIYTPTNGMTQFDAPPNNNWLAITMGAAAMAILGFTHLVIWFERRLKLEKKQSQAAEQKAVRLSEILDESSNEIYFFDSETLHFVNVNRGATDNLGYTGDELKNMTPMDVKPEFDEEGFRELIRPLRDGEKNDLLIETSHRRKDGTDYAVQVHLQLSMVTHPPMYVAIITDITDRKNLEAQLSQAKKMESIGQLAAGIAHEINTPAQFVGDNTKFIKEAFTELLDLTEAHTKLLSAVKEDSITPELVTEVEAANQTADVEYLAEEIPSAIDQSLDGISRISNIVRAMKEFSHPGGKDREATDLNSAISNTVIVASNEWKYVADLETDLAPDLPPVPCYAQEINQAILNLIVNAAHAIEASNQGDETKKGQITVRTRAISDIVEISIADNGCGIPEEIRERIFDHFFTTKEVGKGTGQGLSIAYQTVVDMHQGTLTVESKEGVGTTFYIRLPIKVEPIAVDEEAA